MNKCGDCYSCTHSQVAPKSWPCSGCIRLPKLDLKDYYSPKQGDPYSHEDRGNAPYLRF